MISVRSEPRHVGIIMDGNGRWAKARGHSRVWGHIRGAKVAKGIIEYAARSGLETLTLFTFSTENWKRPEVEVEFLMGLLVRYLRSELPLLLRHNIRFQTMGDIEGLPVIVRDTLNQARSRTADCTGLRLVFAVNYGGRQDIVGACRRIATQVAEGGISPSAIDEGLLSASLFAAEAGDLDLIIRTSGESRLSNFMLWQAAYAELYFVDKHWPDFTTKDFAVAIDNFRSRERRFGKTADQLQPSVRFEHVVASP